MSHITSFTDYFYVINGKPHGNNSYKEPQTLYMLVNICMGITGKPARQYLQNQVLQKANALQQSNKLF